MPSGITEMCSVSCRGSQILAVRSGQDETSISRVFALVFPWGCLWIGFMKYMYWNTHGKITVDSIKFQVVTTAERNHQETIVYLPFRICHCFKLFHFLLSLCYFDIAAPCALSPAKVNVFALPNTTCFMVWKPVVNAALPLGWKAGRELQLPKIVAEFTSKGRWTVAAQLHSTTMKHNIQGCSMWIVLVWWVFCLFFFFFLSFLWAGELCGT